MIAQDHAFFLYNAMILFIFVYFFAILCRRNLFYFFRKISNVINERGGGDMLKKIVRTIISFGGMTIGFGIYFLLLEILQDKNIELSPMTRWFGLMIIVIAFGALFEVLTPLLIRSGQQIISRIEKESSKVGALEMIIGFFGATVGIIISYFISTFTLKIPYIGLALTIIIYLFFVFLGYSLSTRRKDEISDLIGKQPDVREDHRPLRSVPGAPKILDTSVIIDGRILDIAATGFLEGRLIVPNFVLEELRHIADSSDDLKRVKGRRGLDILNTMQAELKMSMEISGEDFPKEIEVDMKLLRLAKEIGGKVLTNDFNLNKVAQLQGVEVLNINELANAVKTVVIPGEEMVVSIVKQGKEQNQGVAYLDDGTMIVVENARRSIGETLSVVVTTVLQTAAGRMIFARQK